jgi:hypothetical protein
VDEHATGRLAPTTRHTGELDDPSHASLQATRSCVRSWKTNWPRTGHLPRSLVGWPEPIPMMRKLRVSHETIYRSLFVQSRGVLRRELTRHLRTGRSVRRSKAHRGLVGDGRGQLTGIVHICERPAEAEDRAVPGHWEGDLGLGKAMSGIATLVERSCRFLLLIKLERIDSQDCRRRAGSAHSHVARTTAPLVDLGSRQPNGPARQVHDRHWCADLVL